MRCQTAFNFVDSGFEIISGTSSTIRRTYIYWAIGDDEIGSDEDCLVDVPNAVTADADATDTTGGYQRGNYLHVLNPLVNDHGKPCQMATLDHIRQDYGSRGTISYDFRQMVL